MFNSSVRERLNRQIPPKQNTLNILAKLKRLNATRKNQSTVANTLIVYKSRLFKVLVFIINTYRELLLAL